MLDPGANAHSGGRLGEALKSAHTFVGTVTYMSPERINGEAYSKPSDIWSLGLSIMACALGRTPVRTAGGYWSILQCVRDEPPPQLPPDDQRWSHEFRDILSRCLRKDPGERATCEELLGHPFLRKYPEQEGERSSSSSSSLGGSSDEDKGEESQQQQPPLASEDEGQDENNPQNGQQRPRRGSGALKIQRAGAEELKVLLKATHSHVRHLFRRKGEKALVALGLPSEAIAEPTAATVELLGRARPATVKSLARQLNISVPMLMSHVEDFTRDLAARGSTD